MSLSKEAIEEFKKIWKEDFGKEISDQEAYESGSNLVNFFKLLYEIDQRNKRDGTASKQKRNNKSS